MIDTSEVVEKVILVAVKRNDRDNTEASLDELEELAQILNRVIRKYDKDAYFEPETSGRLISVLWD